MENSNEKLENIETENIVIFAPIPGILDDAGVLLMIKGSYRLEIECYANDWYTCTEPKIETGSC